MRPLSLIFFALTLVPAGAQLPLPSAEALGQDLFLRSGSTGMVLVVVRDQQVFFRGFGETAPGSNQLPTRDSLLRLCSLSKIFASDLLIKLAGDHTLRLDDPLQRFAPSTHLLVPARAHRSITLADLATHTAGLPRELGPAPRDTPHFTFPNFATRWAWLPHQRLRATPGTSALYSNLGFDLLGDALQSAARQPYAQLLAARTTTPLSMRQTTFSPTQAQCARLLLGAHDQGSCTDTQASAGSSGLYSTATDMALFLKYLLRTGTPAQNPAAQAVYLQPANLLSVQGLDHAGTPSGIGLGWMHLLPPGSPSHLIEKTGGGAGFLTYIALNHARHTAIFLAATDGSSETHLNLFKAANDLLLTLAGLPPLPPEPRPVRRPVRPISPRRRLR